MLDPFKSDLEHGRQILKRFALARAAIVSVVATSCAVVHTRSAAAIDISTAYLFAILAVALIESLVVAFVMDAGYKRPTIQFSCLLLCADLVLITAIVLLTGGSGSVFAFLYVAAILSTSILLTFKWSLIIASISSVLFLVAMVLEQEGIVMTAVAFRSAATFMSGDELWAYSSMKVFAFYLTAFLGGYLSRQIGFLQSIHQNILNSFPSGFISINTENDITFLNAAAARLLGCQRGESVGKRISSVFTVADGQANPLEEFASKQEECQSKEVVLTRRDGGQIPIGITVSQLTDRGKRNIGAVASFTDLTEVKRMEERLRRADMLAAIGEMSASLAHEIRNPVASIRGSVQELSENLPLNGTTVQLMKIAMRESDHLSGIIASFLGFVDASPREESSYDVRRLLDETVQVARQRFTRYGEFRIIEDYSDDLGDLVGDRSRIKEAVLNIIENAVEATNEGGDVRIRAYKNGGVPGTINIRIEDRGRGIPPEQMGKVFDLFYTTKPRGIGLGMAIVHKIIDSHGGSIDIESSVGQGTTVSIALPREG